MGVESGGWRILFLEVKLLNGWQVVIIFVLYPWQLQGVSHDRVLQIAFGSIPAAGPPMPIAPSGHRDATGFLSALNKSALIGGLPFFSVFRPENTAMAVINLCPIQLLGHYFLGLL